jgi:hypothetical protein
LILVHDERSDAVDHDQNGDEDEVHVNELKCPPGKDDAQRNVDAAIKEELFRSRCDGVIRDRGGKQEDPEGESDSESKPKASALTTSGEDGYRFPRLKARVSSAPIGIAPVVMLPLRIIQAVQTAQRRCLTDPID